MSVQKTPQSNEYNVNQKINFHEAQASSDSEFPSSISHTRCQTQQQT
jgi:hypothetical protein